MPLQPIATRRLYLQIADQIRALVASGEAAPGERLPAERDLAKHLRVSRPSLREALIALEVEGLLEVRVGSGIYVTRPRRRRSTEIDSAVGPFDVIRARRMIEGECAALAARAARPAQVAAIRDAHERYQRASRRHHNPIDADRLFHLRVAEASGNSAFVLVVQTLWDQRVGPLYLALERKLEYPLMAADTLREHSAVLSAIERRDARAARAAMRQHMDLTRKRYSKDFRSLDQ
jgi:DNA-binding FadR family transcriptional regulator